jgi:hypothetical protein
MNSPLQQLIALVPPPANPVAPGTSEAWSRIETEIGSRLPQDFKDYIKVYGAGQWLNFFGVMNPFYGLKHPQADRSWRDWMTNRIGHLNEIEEQAKPITPHSRRILFQTVFWHLDTTTTEAHCAGRSPVNQINGQ